MRRVVHVGVCLLVLALAASSAARVGEAVGTRGASAPGLDRYRLRATPAEVDELRRSGIDVVATRAGGIAEAVMASGEVERVAALGFRPERWRDPEGRSVADLARPDQPGGYRVWRSWDEPGGLRDELTGLARRRPDLVSAQVIGRSVRGRDILAVRVTGGAPDVPDGTRPAVLYLGLQHAREWISGEVTRRLLHSVVDAYGVDPETTRLLDTTELWFVVVANPDGYQLTFQPGRRLWRKNLADNDGDGRLTSEDGVDLNRNFPDHWGYSPAGSSANPADQLFRGSAPGSEPETQALLGLARRIPFRFVVNYHAFAQLILYPIGWQEQTPTADQPIYTVLAGTALNPAIPGYQPKLSTDFYPTNGETTSWAHAEAGALAFTVELGEGAPDMGFLFPDNEALIEAEHQLNRPFALDVARAAAGPAQAVSYRGTTAAPFAIDTFEVSYGDPQPVQATVARHLGPVTVHWQVGTGPEQAAPARDWAGGTRYGAAGDEYYRRVRGAVTGARPGDTVRVWFSAGGRRSDEFAYRLESASGRPVLVVAGADQSPQAGPPPGAERRGAGRQRLAPILQALAGNGIAADTYDVDGRGRVAPHPLGVLGHYRAVIFTAGEPPGGAGGAEALPVTVSRLANIEMLSLRHYLNDGGRLLYTGRAAGEAHARRYEYSNGDSPCLPTSDHRPGPAGAGGTVERHDPCVALSDEFFVTWLGAYRHIDGGGAAPDGSLSPALGTSAPFAGLEWTFDPDGGGGATSAAYIPTADTFGESYPALGGRVAARYRSGPPPIALGSRRLPPPAAVVTTPATILFGFGFEDVAADARTELMGRALGYLLRAAPEGFGAGSAG